VLRLDYTYEAESYEGADAGPINCPTGTEESRRDRKVVRITVSDRTAGEGGRHTAGGVSAAAGKTAAGNSIAAEDRSTDFHLYLKEGEHSVYFYSRQLGFVPSSIRVGEPVRADRAGASVSIAADQAGAAEQTGASAPEPPAAAAAGAGNRFSVRAVEAEEVSMYAENTPPPIPADMGTLMHYGRENWRRSDWELFSWNLFPHMLVFDFKNYRVQAAFLKRLAFYVEKKGFAGRLHPNELIDDLHGWNAHDYRATDLASFFNLAESEDFDLNREEMLLADILLDNGILTRGNGRYEAGEGGIISLSQESSDRLRYLFVTHEGYHGLFFASEEYRERVEKIWASLADTEKEFWRMFLAWRHYDVKDEYLLQNEFQAYLMQQHISHVEEYFKDYIIPRFTELFPEKREEMERFLAEHPDHFIENARKVERAACEIAGIRSGDLVCLREDEAARKADD
jgi:hypothetical protein